MDIYSIIKVEILWIYLYIDVNTTKTENKGIKLDENEDEKTEFSNINI